MTSSAAFRPVLVSLLGLAAAACGGVEADPHRFENLAERVAAIPISTTASRDAPTPRSAQQAGLRGGTEPVARPDLRVEVMDPHDLWDARDAGLRGLVEQAGPGLAEAAAPLVAEAMVRQASAAVARALPEARRVPERVAETTTAARTTIQLGAFSSEKAAQDAWARLIDGPAARAFGGLSPRFEPVQVNGRPLTRLKVGPVPAHAAAVICRAAEVTDPWCRRQA